MNNYIINALTIILDTYQSILAFFYQKILQNSFINNDLTTYDINYNLLLPSSQYLTFLTTGQVNAQMQAYINLCNDLIKYITNLPIIQTNLFYEQIQNTLNISISQLNGFALSLLESQFNNILIYYVPFNMSMTNVLFLNNINLNTWQQQVKLNAGIRDFNNILQNTQLNLTRG